MVSGLPAVLQPQALEQHLWAFVRQHSSLPFSRPCEDCCMVAADWVLSVTGVDPAADLRGKYHNAAGAVRLVRQWGGFDAMWRVHMALAGFNTTHHPVAGDVGVVVDLAGQQVAGVKVGGAWAVKAARGMLLEDLPCLVAWEIVRG